MADPKGSRDTSEKVLPRREDEGARRDTERRENGNPSRHEKRQPGRESEGEVRPM